MNKENKKVYSRMTIGELKEWLDKNKINDDTIIHIGLNPGDSTSLVSLSQIIDERGKSVLKITGEVY